jgi:hypothetical protein
MGKRIFNTPEEEIAWKEHVREYNREYKKRPKYKTYIKNFKAGEDYKKRQREYQFNRWRSDDFKKVRQSEEYKQRHAHYQKSFYSNPENVEKRKERHRERKKEYERLLSLMTPKQRGEFLANKNRIRIEKARLKKVNEILARQQAVIEEHREKISKAKKLQMHGLEIEKQRLDLAQLNRVIVKLDSMKESRMARYQALRKSPRSRYLWAIDYYYQLVEESKPLLQAA